MSVDIVVVNYHTPDDLEDFLASLNLWPPVTPATLTVVEVDDGDYERSISWAGGEGVVVGLAGNVGYGRACNLAAQRGRGSVLAFFNADIVLRPGALDACCVALTSHPGWGVLGPLQTDGSNRVRHAGIFGTLAAPAHRGWNQVNRGQFNDVRDAVTVSGSAYFVRRQVWEELSGCAQYREVAPDAAGAFLETPHYYEETWASYHAHAHGHNVVYYGEVSLIHKWHRASSVGGPADRQMPVSQAMFRNACERHGIAHD